MSVRAHYAPLVAGLVSAGRATRWGVRDLGESVVLCGWVVAAVTCWLPWLVVATAWLRRDVTRQRDLALALAEIDVPRAYGREIVRQATYAESGREVARQLRDPATRGDLWWHLYNPIVGTIIALGPLALLLEICWGLAQPALYPAVGDAIDGAFVWGIPCTSMTLAVVGALVSLGMIYPVLRWACPWLLRLHGRWVRRMLTSQPSTDDLRRRVDELDATRRSALDLQAAELLRIERDLHDGAQAKLVAIGMNLTAIETLIETDPGAARTLITRLRDTSVAALDELRTLVRGIVPPVLADRGLLQALRGLAAEHELDVTVVGAYPRRLAMPLESALYFATSECLSNAAKHSGGARVEVVLDQSAARTTITVTDDGRGGAVVSPGGGLDGVRRRLAPFDGRLELSSPDGGPTRVSITAPHPE